MARTDPQLNVRMPPELLELLKAAAVASGRTLAAEIIERLEWSFPETVEALLLSRRLAERDLLDSLGDRLSRLGRAAEEAGDKAKAAEYDVRLDQLWRYRDRIDYVARRLSEGAGMPTSDDVEAEKPAGEVVQFPKRG